MLAVVVLTCFLLPNRRLSYAKIVQMSGKRARSLFPECSLSYAKIMQMSGKRARSLFPECSLSYAKIMQDECNVKTGKRSFTGLDTAEPMLILCKDSETRPISDGFKKNNVNYWVFRDLCSIILHS